MSKKKSEPTSARNAKLAEARKAQQAAERKRTILLVVAAGLVIAFILGAVGWAVWNERGERKAAGDLSGVQEYEHEAMEHTQSKVDYSESPPTGGEHNPVWMNCGVYDEPLPDEHAVHSLEHGAVWITYKPDLEQSEVDELEKITPDTYALLSPYEGDMDSPIVISAWGFQLGVDSADDPRLKGFIEEYRQGEQTPEPGAACTGGIDSPSQSQVQ